MPSGVFSPRLWNGSGAATQAAAEKYVNQPVSPCSSGVAPVNDVVIALAVVDGNTALIAPRRWRAMCPPAPLARR